MILLCIHACVNRFISLAFAESLQAEVGHLGIRTFCIEPGFFRTEVLKEGNLASSVSRIPDYKTITENSAAFIEGTYYSYYPLRPSHLTLEADSQ